ncbi:MAG TPA: AAA family ATPase [Candidatus Hydrogenedens sp.]|nr:AAA family ATPase [Candidatus Hydrogenedens sp.]
MISLIEAKSYRCIRYIRQNLQPFQILVGPNGSGKTTFLDVIAFMRDLINEGLDDALQKRANILDELLWKGEGNEFELAVEVKIPQKLQNNGGGKYSACRYEIAIGGREGKEIAILSETLWLKGENDGELKNMPGEYSLFPSEVEPPKTILRRGGHNWRRIINKTERGNDYFRSEKTEWNNIFKIGPTKSALANLPEDEEKFPVSTWFKSILMDKVQTLTLNSILMKRPASPLRKKGLFITDGSNIPFIVKALKEEHKERFKLWIKHIQTVIEDLKDIDVVERPEDKHLYLVGEYKSGIRVPAWLLSDGTLRLLALTLLAYFPADNHIYLIEEPENGIHPRAIEAVYQSLSSVYDSQVFLATHSPIILGVAKPDDVLCFAKNSSGSISIIRGTEHPALKNWQGTPNLSVLYASGVLG